MAGDEQELYRLSDLDVDAIGLVRRGANQKPFYFVKSVDGGSESMADKQEEETFSLDDLGEVEEVDAGWAKKLVGWLKGMQAAKEEPAPDPEQHEPEPVLAPEPAPEQASDDEGKNFSEALEVVKREMSEQFAQELKVEREKREEFADKFAAEQHLRRLHEFADMVGQDFGSLPVGETEQFAADLMAIHDADEERYGRMVNVLKASQEAMKQGALFEQYSNAQPVSGDPFLAAVEKIQQEKFSDKPRADGYALAFDAAMKAHPDLAAQYERSTRAAQ